MEIRLRLPKVADGVAMDYAGSSAPASQRVQNGDFASATGWDTSGAAWTIAAGVATNVVLGPFLTGTLSPPLSGGEAFNFSFTVVANPMATACGVQLYNSSTLATQLIFSDGVGAGLKTSSGTVSGAFDKIRIGAADADGLVIDNMSLIA